MTTRREPISDTKDRIVEAAIETLRVEGFAGTSARAIARRGDFNQALIFYHFGTLGDLLLAAFDRTGERALERYRGAMKASENLEERVRRATGLYREDLDSGHVTVVCEMIAGSLSRPDLGPEVVRRVEPWIDLAEETMGEVLERTGLAELVPPRAAAFAVISLSLGVNLMTYLEGDEARAEALFEMGERLAQVVVPMLGGLAADDA